MKNRDHVIPAIEIIYWITWIAEMIILWLSRPRQLSDNTLFFLIGVDLILSFIWGYTTGARGKVDELLNQLYGEKRSFYRTPWDIDRILYKIKIGEVTVPPEIVVYLRSGWRSEHLGGISIVILFCAIVFH
jgi:hypothetical protein